MRSGRVNLKKVNFVIKVEINSISNLSSFLDVAYGSKIVLRHLNDHIGYLHSHEHNWIDGSRRETNFHCVR